ncbi:BRO family protein [Exiguobacterium sp. s80]|uniref:BRO-N domain-containing protein n=1 Tax=Exiguobacterium sp. s80 TaxID=2751209 RepID=UPI001BE4E672|nr:BRO family protein [Exiguobacterium sp. s80]
MNQLTKIFEGNEIRMIQKNKIPLFVASDVAKVLGYKEPHKAVSRHCKGGMKHPVLTNGGTQDMIVILTMPF